MRAKSPVSLWRTHPRTSNFGTVISITSPVGNSRFERQNDVGLDVRSGARVFPSAFALSAVWISGAKLPPPEGRVVTRTSEDSFAGSYHRCRTAGTAATGWKRPSTAAESATRSDRPTALRVRGPRRRVVRQSRQAAACCAQPRVASRVRIPALAAHCRRPL